MPVSHGDSVRIAYVGRLTDGTIFDTSDKTLAETEGLLDENPSRDFAPLTVEIGDDSVIPGVEEALLGMEVGETKSVTLPPEKGSGERSEDRIADYDREAFEEMLGDTELEEGVVVETDQGLPGEVAGFDDESVTVDFNHELAGETLEFEIEVLDSN